MDSIDITCSEYSLSNIPHSILNQSESIEFNFKDYLIYFYIAFGIIVFGIFLFLFYKFYLKKSKHVSFQEKTEEYYNEKG